MTHFFLQLSLFLSRPCSFSSRRNGQSNCCFSPVIQMEILISLLKESTSGQSEGGCGVVETNSEHCKEEEREMKGGITSTFMQGEKLESMIQLDLMCSKSSQGTEVPVVTVIFYKHVSIIACALCIMYHYQFFFLMISKF